jgi:RNA polymerase sigma-70 factor (ECF subfamily)
MGQRLARAKNKIRAAGIPFRVPEQDELRERLDVVLDAIYAVYAEGWSDPLGTETRRRNLAQEGLWLGRLVASLLPAEPEALGLLALMLHTEARRDARRNAASDYVPLAEQDVALWNAAMIDEAEALLIEASGLQVIGRYQLEAAVQSAHVVRRRGGSADGADWAAIESLYRALLALTASPVVAINHAVALAETRGPQAGLGALDALAGDTRLADYQPFWAARAGLLARCNQGAEADQAYERAIGLEADPAVRRFLQGQRAALAP